MTPPIRVLIADDSGFVCGLLRSYLEASGEFVVVGAAGNGRRAVEMAAERNPDVVTLDLDMPELDGLEALSTIMRECPCPVVVISGVSGKAATMTLQALDRGAVDFVVKYTPGSDTPPDLLRREIIDKVRVAANLGLGSSEPRSGEWSAFPAANPFARTSQNVSVNNGAAAKTFGDVTIVGAAAGGPSALREFLAAMPVDSATALVIVQHMPSTFTGVLAAQLNRHARVRVREACANDVPAPGRVLVAPGGVHLFFGAGGRIDLRAGPSVDGYCPSIDVTMQSAVHTFGSKVKGVLLTGTGTDGRRGLAAIQAAGGETFAQDPACCVAAGMPRYAIAAGVVEHVAPIARIARLVADGPPKVLSMGA